MKETRSAGDLKIKHSLELAGTTLGFNDLLDEMERAGIEMRTFESKKQYYISLTYPERK